MGVKGVIEHDYETMGVFPASFSDQPNSAVGPGQWGSYQTLSAPPGATMYAASTLTK